MFERDKAGGEKIIGIIWLIAGIIIIFHFWYLGLSFIIVGCVMILIHKSIKEQVEKEKQKAEKEREALIKIQQGLREEYLHDFAKKFFNPVSSDITICDLIKLVKHEKNIELSEEKARKLILIYLEQSINEILDNEIFKLKKNNEILDNEILKLKKKSDANLAKMLFNVEEKVTEHLMNMSSIQDSITKRHSLGMSYPDTILDYFFNYLDKKDIYYDKKAIRDKYIELEEAQEAERIKAELKSSDSDYSPYYDCQDCGYSWETKKRYGSPSKCPNCGSSNIQNVEVE